MKPMRGAGLVGFWLVLASLAFGGCASGVGEIPGPSSEEDRIVENLEAFARLYGYVRWFHPDDRAASIDWDAFAIHGARRVWDSATPDELRRNLERLFLPIAPTVRIYPAGREPASSMLVPADTSGLKLIAWQHRGVGLSDHALYRSIRLNRPAPFDESEGQVYREVDTAGLRGRKVRLSADARLQTAEDAGRLHLALLVQGEDGKIRFADTMADRPITSNEWARYEIVGSVMEDAASLTVAVVLVGTGRALVDDMRLEVEEDGRWRMVERLQIDTEEGGGAPLDEVRGWGVERSRDAEHEIQVLERVGPRTNVLVISLEREPVAEPLFAARPSVGDATESALGRGLRARVPVALYGTEDRTLGDGSAPDPQELQAELSRVKAEAPGPEDPAVRAAAVLTAWNVLQHFYPYFDVVDADWNRVLGATLRGALREEPESSETRVSLQALNWMLARLDDAHAEVFHPILRDDRGLPLRLDWIDEQVVVVATDDTALARVGDVVLSLDGVPATDWLTEAMAYFSGSDRWERYRALTHPHRGFGRGEAGSEAVLTLVRDGRELVVEAVRDVREIPHETRPGSFQRLADSIVYVDLVTTSMEEIASRIDELARAEGVIFDLRGHPNDTDVRLVLGHLTNDTLRSGYWHIPQIIYPDRQRIAGWTDGSRWEIAPRSPRFRGAVAFLSDASAVSFPEGILGIVEVHDLGEIVGQASAGATGNINVFRLPGSYQAGFTGMKYLKPDSARHHVVGVQPTVPVQRSIETVRHGRDRYLQRSIEILRDRNRPR